MQERKGRIEKAISTSVAQMPTSIETDRDLTRAIDAASSLRDTLSLLEKGRKSAGEPHLRAKQAVDTFYKPYTEQLKYAVKSIKVMIADFHTKKEQEQREVEAHEAKETDDDVVLVDDTISSFGKDNSEDCSASIRKVIEYRIKNEGLRDVVIIKPKLLQKFLDNNPLPDFIEGVEVKKVTLRNK